MKGVESVTYKLSLPPSMSGVHLVFYVSILKKYHKDEDYIIRWDHELFDKEIYYKVEQRHEKIKDKINYLCKVLMEEPSYWRRNLGDRDGHM